jgi:hypothetical protein
MVWKALRVARLAYLEHWPMCSAVDVAIFPASADVEGALSNISVLGVVGTWYPPLWSRGRLHSSLVGQVEHCWSVASAGHEGGMSTPACLHCPSQ